MKTLALTVSCLVLFSYGIMKSDDSDLNELFLSLEKNANSVEFSQSNDYDSLYFVQYIEVADWSEWFKVACVKSNRVEWIGAPDSGDFTEMSVLGGRIIKLRNTKYPVAEAYGATHAGNGYIHLFKIINKQLVEFFSDYAVDYHYENTGMLQDSSEVFKNGFLKPTYLDLNNDGYDDLILQDTVMIYRNDTILLGSKPIKKTYLWDNAKQTFEEKK